MSSEGCRQYILAFPTYTKSSSETYIYMKFFNTGRRQNATARDDDFPTRFFPCHQSSSSESSGFLRAPTPKDDIIMSLT